MFVAMRIVLHAFVASLAFLTQVCAAADSASAAGRADEGTYPSRPVRVIVPFPPGGGDIVARIVAQMLSERMGQPFVVDNRPGAGSTLGTELAAKATPDGYTVLFATSALAISAAVYPRLAYDPVTDFAPVSAVGFAPLVLVLHPSVPATTVKELIALARAKPNALNYASNGSGSITYVAAELFKHLASARITEVTYKGAGPSITALLSGEVQLMFAPLGPTLAHIKAGKLRAIAMPDDKRSPLLPDVPTIAESGLPGYAAANWYGMAAPRATPRKLIVVLNRHIVAVLEDADVKARFSALGYEATPSTPEEFGRYVRADIQKWKKVIAQAGVKAN